MEFLLLLLSIYTAVLSSPIPSQPDVDGKKSHAFEFYGSSTNKPVIYKFDFRAIQEEVKNYDKNEFYRNLIANVHDKVKAQAGHVNETEKPDGDIQIDNSITSVLKELRDNNIAYDLWNTSDTNNKSKHKKKKEYIRIKVKTDAVNVDSVQASQLNPLIAFDINDYEEESSRVYPKVKRDKVIIQKTSIKTPRALPYVKIPKNVGEIIKLRVKNNLSNQHGETVANVTRSSSTSKTNENKVPGVVKLKFDATVRSNKTNSNFRMKDMDAQQNKHVFNLAKNILNRNNNNNNVSLRSPYLNSYLDFQINDKILSQYMKPDEVVADTPKANMVQMDSEYKDKTSFPRSVSKPVRSHDSIFEYVFKTKALDHTTRSEFIDKNDPTLINWMMTYLEALRSTQTTQTNKVTSPPEVNPFVQNTERNLFDSIVTKCLLRPKASYQPEKTDKYEDEEVVTKVFMNKKPALTKRVWTFMNEDFDQLVTKAAQMKTTTPARHWEFDDNLITKYPSRDDTKPRRRWQFDEAWDIVTKQPTEADVQNPWPFNRSRNTATQNFVNNMGAPRRHHMSSDMAIITRPTTNVTDLTIFNLLEFVAKARNRDKVEETTNYIPPSRSPFTRNVISTYATRKSNNPYNMDHQRRLMEKIWGNDSNMFVYPSLSVNVLHRRTYRPTTSRKTSTTNEYTTELPDTSTILDNPWKNPLMPPMRHHVAQIINKMLEVQTEDTQLFPAIDDKAKYLKDPAAAQLVTRGTSNRFPKIAIEPQIPEISKHTNIRNRPFRFPMVVTREYNNVDTLNATPKLSVFYEQVQPSNQTNSTNEYLLYLLGQILPNSSNTDIISLLETSLLDYPRDNNEHTNKLQQPSHRNLTTMSESHASTAWLNLVVGDDDEIQSIADNSILKAILVTRAPPVALKISSSDMYLVTRSSRCYHFTLQKQTDLPITRYSKLLYKPEHIHRDARKGDNESHRIKNKVEYNDYDDTSETSTASPRKLTWNRNILHAILTEIDRKRVNQELEDYQPEEAKQVVWRVTYPDKKVNVMNGFITRSQAKVNDFGVMLNYIQRPYITDNSIKNRRNWSYLN